ncbi:MULTISPECIES: glycosyltransferase family 2 protein [Elizabethkingia]|uniref:glycosyltransferase family 2 protein n=1 Tax=Elizabethkingia TaxID=308865 RepID=UPI0009C19B06|nr:MULTISPECIES: glycosyltransferase family 2 protein [Elizabethkingia]MCL1655383.1 glycosyltransferase family 2 protein [Elizabethkingia miricola]MCP1252895.1 glycosyltransferase family 2 protein [Elizabethkingia sp. S0634]MDX8573092.1 glycosyltransferase family 2 protein [Elizabethkingia sp. HX QKY]
MKVQNNNVLVTIAIPFFNAQEFLTQAIDSVIQQTFQNWNLLLVDDGSTDDSMKIAKHYESIDKRIRVYSDGKNKNLAYRLNQIPDLVGTEYLARMDADDIMHPRKIETQMNVLLNHPEIDVLGTNAYSIDENNMVFGIRIQLNGIDVLQNVKGFIHPTIIAKTNWFLQNKYDDQALRIEDTELWYRTYKNNNFAVIKEPLFFYREIGKDYYKKYYSANIAKEYILKKHSQDNYWKRFFFNNLCKGFVYQLFNFFKKEDYLIKKRNQIILKKSIHYLQFIKDDKDNSNFYNS